MIKRTRSRRRRASVPEFWSYVVRVSRSQPSYSFSINGVPGNEGPFWEYAGLEISANVWRRPTWQHSP